jgi:hypothetical protein
MPFNLARMIYRMLKQVIFICAAGSLLLVSAAPTSIGFVTSAGEFRVDGSSVRKNGTVFEGTLIETAAARSVVHLDDALISLAPESRLRVYHDHAVLERGTGSVQDGMHYIVAAATLRVVPSSRASVVQIQLTAPSLLTVSAAGGPAEVRSSSNLLAGSVLPGTALAFDPQAGPPTSVKMTGIVESRDGAFFLTDETSKVLFQIEGSGVAKHVGKRVEITGTTVQDATPAGGASQLVRVGDVKKIAAGGAAAAGTGGASSSAGLSAAAIGAIVGGVAVAAAVGGLAAAGTFSNGASVSRP